MEESRTSKPRPLSFCVPRSAGVTKHTIPNVWNTNIFGAQELIERINQHPDDFLRLMNEPPDAEGQAMMEMG